MSASEGGAGGGGGAEPLLTVSGLGHRYPGESTDSLGEVAFQAAHGELLTLVGPSGCGKSTLLRAVGGLQTPSRGRVLLDGRPVSGVPEGLAVVFQDYSRSLFPWLTVGENVALPLRRSSGAGMSRARRRGIAEEALEAVGLGAAAARRRTWELSGGMQQRVAIARALACVPRLLLMDEPFGSVDAQTREDLEDLLLAVRAERGMTVLVVTHDIDEAVYLGDRVLVLSGRPGRLVADLDVPLGHRRRQVATRAEREFVALRAEVATLVRGAEPAPGLPRARRR
ncbi:ABC transporter ATP-binding protein [Phaeacidiphilus oryzae]|uniref:ABC transporter ATP-binding protein n=1 Tax=Phaeacidiphilus oryzae TaxID=348818 RepID=UPI0009FFBE5A|nr:ABC transporter ATP-binding protein [Phaeacidiphilus oryzae]